VDYARLFTDDGFLVIHLSQKERIKNRELSFAYYCKFPIPYRLSEDFLIHLHHGNFRTFRTFFYALGTKITRNINLEAWTDNGTDNLEKLGLTYNTLILEYPQMRRAPISVHINEVGKLKDHLNMNFIRSEKHKYEYEESEEIV
jgi:hypothetical protein